MADSSLVLAQRAYRHYKTDGVPSSGINEPDKDEIVAVFRRQAEEMSNIGSVAGSFGRATLAELQATSAADGTIGTVLFDTPENTGVYKRIAGAWVWQSDLPADAAAASANAAEQARKGAEDLRDETQLIKGDVEQLKTDTAGIATDVDTAGDAYVAEMETLRDAAAGSYSDAQALVDAASAGFTGIAPGTALDLGSVADANVYFPLDMGTLS